MSKTARFFSLLRPSDFAPGDDINIDLEPEDLIPAPVPVPDFERAIRVLNAGRDTLEARLSVLDQEISVRVHERNETAAVLAAYAAAAERITTKETRA
jgi:hypothetical protein